MKTVVQKFGGSSVADVTCLKRVANRVAETVRDGCKAVVVVSAMGDTTDELIELSREINPNPSDREMDMLLSTGEQISSAMLAMALHSLGVDAVSMTGPQAGIFTDHVHAKAKIMDIQPQRILDHWANDRVVIVAGFQGLTPSQDVATLGRGGSDTTAVALAAALKAHKCQIFTDVEGVYTSDPRVVADARKLDVVTHDEMLELASLGAKVLQSRAVEFAKKYEVVLEVLSSFTNAPGTTVQEEVADMEQIVVRGVAADKDQVKVTLRSVPDEPGQSARIFKSIAAANVNVDMIVQNTSAEGCTDVSFTLPHEDLQRARKAVDDLVAETGIPNVQYDPEVAKISIVGVGMRGHSGVAYRMFEVLAAHRINIEMISTSEIKVSVVIRRDQADEAVRALHDAFELGKQHG